MKLKGMKLNFNSKDKLTEPKLPRDYGAIKTIGRVLVVLFILYLSALSILYLTDANGRSVRQKTEKIDSFFAEPEKYLNQQGFYSFAGIFIRDFLTHDGLERDLGQYSSMEIPIAWPTDLKAQRVEETFPVSVIMINENQAVVRMGAYISSIFSAKIQGDPDIEKELTLYFDLAIYKQGDQYLINELPQVIASLPKAEEGFVQSTLLETSGDDAASIMADVESFMKAYLEGSVNDIAYFTDLKLNGLRGSVKYNGIEKSQVFILPENSNGALVKIDVLTEVEGIGMKQHFELSMERKDKWKVKYFGAVCPEFENYIKTVEEE